MSEAAVDKYELKKKHCSFFQGTSRGLNGLLCVTELGMQDEGALTNQR